MSQATIIYKPALQSWLPLLGISVPIGLVGVLGLLEGAYLEGVGAMAFAALILGYNATIRLRMDGEMLTFSRFGRKVWSVLLRDGECKEERAGDGNFLPAHVFYERGERVGFLLRGWFPKEDIAEVRSHLQND